MVLTLDPAEVGLAPTEALPHVWGMVMDIGVREGWASLVTLADGTTSLYTSGGGGVIGGGAHETVVEASGSLLQQVEANLHLFELTDDLDPPADGQTRFLVLTYDGTLGGSYATEHLSSSKGPLAPFFAAANDLLTALRLATGSSPE
jgi:hypothetical protein